jgi:hypothetical protein
MSKSLSFLILAAFTLALPLNSWALVAQNGSAPGTDLQSSPTEPAAELGAGPTCPDDSRSTGTESTATGAIASTEATAAEARATACCWIYWGGRWWCVPCY